MSEHQNIDYKQSCQDDYLKWICGFANAQGGVIYVGKDYTINDNRNRKYYANEMAQDVWEIKKAAITVMRPTRSFSLGK